MSGGSFDYLYLKEPGELFEQVEYIEIGEDTLKKRFEEYRKGNTE